mmetsp:Transcript_6709/g.14668  ORF Transcript_6709/g.14668 Transcript_6709/m.14668 type:complete len:614 (+) Transcript_6709:91-1932(+)
MLALAILSIESSAEATGAQLIRKGAIHRRPGRIGGDVASNRIGEPEKGARKALSCDPACPDDQTYVSKIGLTCSEHAQFQCPMFLVLGYDEADTAELIERCPCTCDVACTTTMPTMHPTATASILAQPATHQSTRSPTGSATVSPPARPTLSMTEFTHAKEPEISTHDSSIPPTPSPSLIGENTGTNLTSHAATTTTGNSASLDDASSIAPTFQVGNDRASLLPPAYDSRTEINDSGMVISIKQVIIICAGFGGLAFVAGIFFHMARRNHDDKNEKECVDEELVVEVGHEGHRHGKSKGSACSSTACSSSGVASEVQYYTYINKTVKDNRTVVNFEKGQNAWRSRIPFSSGKKVTNKITTTPEHVLQEIDRDCEGPIPIIFSHNQDEFGMPMEQVAASVTMSSAPKNEEDRTSLCSDQYRSASWRRHHGESGAENPKGCESHKVEDGTTCRDRHGKRRAQKDDDSSYTSVESRDRNRHRRQVSRSSRRYQKQGRTDCGLGLGLCVDDSYGYDNYSQDENNALAGNNSRARIIETRGTRDADTSYFDDSAYRRNGGTFWTYDDGTYAGQSQGTYDNRHHREEDITLSTKRRLIQNGGAWGRMLKRDLEKECEAS